MRSDTSKNSTGYALDPTHIRVVRLIAGISQSQIATAIGRSQGYFSCFERGQLHLSPSEARLVAEFLGLDVRAPR